MNTAGYSLANIYSFPASGDFFFLLIIFANWTQIRPDKMSGLIWSQTVWHSDGIPERPFWKKLIKKKSTDDKKAYKITQHAKSLGNWIHLVDFPLF